ncbi:unnamed protein product [Alopecurus aequalis]
MRSSTVALLAISMAFVICCSSTAAQGAPVPHGDHDGWIPPSPHGGQVHHMCPDPEPECNRPSAPPSPTPPTPDAAESSPHGPDRKTLRVGTGIP